MRQVILDRAMALEAHGTLAGGATGLSEIVGTPPAPRTVEPVEWLVPVTPDTVYHLEGLYRLAIQHGATLRFEPTPDLGERAAAFFDDFLTNHPDRPGSLGSRITQATRALGSVAHDVLAATLRTFGSTSATPVPAPSAAPLKHVVLIGAYGGDHVGDAAILGGVLQGLHSARGTTEASVLSHRPDHTRRLSARLDTPVRLSVHRYETRAADRLLDEANALVLAGGPLMDLPRVLAKHLATVGSARRRGLPFLIDRIGVGPFSRRASRWAARRIARSAGHISVRTSGAAGDPVLEGLSVDVGADPAFDYLDTRKALTRLTDRDANSATALLEGTEGRLLIGLNLRPIRHRWSEQGKAYSRAVETRMLERLATALMEYAETSHRPVTFVFFPMNAIQFGGSDLTSAFRLHRLLRGKVDLRVWEADPDVDGVLYLLRRLDLTITMRFHACIFALSQGLPVVGIDYYPGQGGKVEELFHDRGLHHDVRRIDTLEADWLVERLTALGSNAG